MNRGVVTLEHVEAADEAFLGHPEDRKIVAILDVVMALQLGEEDLQARREEAREPIGRKHPFTKLRRGRSERAAEIAETAMPVEPKACRFAEIGVARPDLARIFHEQDGEIRRPAARGSPDRGALRSRSSAMIALSSEQ